VRENDGYLGQGEDLVGAGFRTWERSIVIPVMGGGSESNGLGYQKSITYSIHLFNC